LEHSPKTSPRGCFVWHLHAASQNLSIWLGLRQFFFNVCMCSFCVRVFMRLLSCCTTERLELFVE
jgi:hypothetical protein